MTKSWQTVSQATVIRDMRSAYRSAKEADDALYQGDLETAKARLSDVLHRLSFGIDYATFGEREEVRP